MSSVKQNPTDPYLSVAIDIRYLILGYRTLFFKTKAKLLVRDKIRNMTEIWQAHMP